MNCYYIDADLNAFAISPAQVCISCIALKKNLDLFLFLLLNFAHSQVYSNTPADFDFKLAR